MDGDLTLLSATEIRRLVGAGEVSPVEVVEASLERIERYNGTLNAVVTLNAAALDEARALEASAKRGGADLPPLFGLPVGIKDVTPVKGVRTTFGSPLYADHVPEEDALVVQRFRQAGAVIVGKTNTPEFAAGGNTFNEVFGRTRNPWNPDLSAGGSTGGGAVGLATGMIAVAEGTDLGGSLRLPAAFCGIVGIRPSPGRVPTWPSDYLWDDLQVTGPMARTAEDLAMVLEAISGPSPLCPVHQAMPGGPGSIMAAMAGARVEGLRVAYCPDPAGIGMDDGVRAVCDATVQALREAGATVDEIEMDLSEGWKAFLHLRGYWMVAHHHKHLDRLDGLGANVAGNIRAGLKVTTEEHAWAEQVRGRMWHWFRDFFQRYDHLLTPTVAVPPFPVEQNYPETVDGRPMKTYIDWLAPTFVLSLTSLPIASVPCGLDERALPVGMQIVGRPFGEGAALGLARIVQELRPMPRPPLEGLG
ncbi:MAG: amidase family protein [Gemmatimonadota bacterium]|nr:amidase family protein [Gemmatimonadota bacterium]